MSLRQTINDDLCHKLRLVGLTKGEVLPIVNTITRSVQAEGPENVVKRLKLLKQAAVNLLAHQEIELPWIAHDSNGPKGPWRVVWKKLKSSNHKQQKRALNALMVYASFVLPKNTSPSQTQEKKFLSSVTHTTQEIEWRELGVKQLTEVRVKSFTAALRRLQLVAGKPHYTGSLPDAMLQLTKLNGADEKGVRKSERAIDSFLVSHKFLSFQAFPEVQEVLGEIGEDYRTLSHPWNGYHLDWRSVKVEDFDQEIGVIGYSQEPGFKFRAFASPNQVLQCAMDLMKRNLLDYLKQCPWDNTHDQSKGVSMVQGWLKEGKTVYSVDLSDATNNFPLTYQMKVLRSLGVIPDSTQRLFELVCRSPYKLMWGNRDNVSWDVGQPLGAGPSFPTFALSHAVLALQAEVLAGIPRNEAGSTFLILGDDFVTNHAEVHERYRELLSVLRCPISEAKCLTSEFAGEFAGKLIMQDYVFHGFKYKEVSDKSFMAIIRTLGKQALSRDLLTKDQYNYAKLVESFPEPMGLGFNPSGIPLAQRWEHWLMVEEELKRHKIRPLTATESELKNSFMYQSKKAYFRYFQAEHEETTPFVTKSTDKVTAVMETIRGAELTASVVNRGDPRPDPLLEVRTRKIGEIQSRMLRLREARSESEDPSINTKLDENQGLNGGSLSNLKPKL